MGTNSVQKPNYNDIAHTLVGLSKKEIYAKLLETKEWFSFREAIHKHDNNKCLHCSRDKGYNEKAFTAVELANVVKYNERVRIHNNALNDIWREQKKEPSRINELKNRTNDRLNNEEWLNVMERSMSRVDAKVANLIREGILLKEGISESPFHPTGKWIHPLGELSKAQSLSVVFLETHHTLYFEDCLPWQYEQKYIKTLCQDCHKEVHRTETIYVYPTEVIYLNPEKSTLYRQVFNNCTKCGGTGHLPEYDYVQNGICFDCGGTGAINK